MRTAFANPAPDPAHAPWAPEQTAALRLIAAKGGDVETAARVTGKSIDAVCRKARRDGLTLRRLVDRRFGPRPPRERMGPPPRYVPVPKLPIVFGDCTGCGEPHMVNAAFVCLDCHTPADKGDIQALIDGARAWAAGQ